MGEVLGILAWCSIVTTKVWCGVAAEARLRLSVFGYAARYVADKHTEALDIRIALVWVLYKAFVLTDWLECCDVAFASRDVVHDETSCSFTRVFVVEEVPAICQFEG